MSFHSLPMSPARELKVTEARLHALYDAARLGLAGDNLAYAAGMTPVELRRLRELNPLTQAAIEKGVADAEAELSQILFDAARAGDAKAALELLKHKHDWVSKQQVQIDVNQQISITAALEQAQGRVIEATATAVLEDAPAHPHTPALALAPARGRPRARERLQCQEPTP